MIFLQKNASAGLLNPDFSGDVFLTDII